MIPQEIIRKKRNKQTLTKDEVTLFVKGLTDSSFSDSQIAAMSMAILLNGMSLNKRPSLKKEKKDLKVMN